MKLIEKIVIHCSDTPNGRNHNAADIHRWHKERGWDGIGYHYVIKIDGAIEYGRPDYWQGAHVRGHNANSLAICLIGTDVFSNQQKVALSSLLSALLNQHKGAKVYGHYQLDDGKTCPNFDVPAWLKEWGFE